jgi:hypothetical protein
MSGVDRGMGEHGQQLLGQPRESRAQNPRPGAFPACALLSPLGVSPRKETFSPLLQRLLGLPQRDATLQS